MYFCIHSPFYTISHTITHSAHTMEVPSSNTGPRKSITPQFDRKRLIEKGLLKRPNDDSQEEPTDEPGSSGSLYLHTDGQKTKYQLEREGEPPQSNPDIVQTLLDSSSVFRSKTAIPHGLLFDLYEEVYPIIEELINIYTANTKTCGLILHNNPDMEDMVQDAVEALEAVALHIGRNCDELDSTEYTTNKFYANAKAGKATVNVKHSKSNRKTLCKKFGKIKCRNQSERGDERSKETVTDNSYSLS